MVDGHWNILQDEIRHNIKVWLWESFLDQAQGSREPAPRFQPHSPLNHHLWSCHPNIDGSVCPGNSPIHDCATTRAKEEGGKEAEKEAEVRCTSNYAQEVMGLDTLGSILDIVPLYCESVTSCYVVSKTTGQPTEVTDLAVSQLKRM